MPIPHLLNAGYIPNNGATILPRLERMCVSGFKLKDFDVINDSIITIGNPTEIAESRKSRGRIGVCQSGCIFGPAITINVPRDD